MLSAALTIMPIPFHEKAPEYYRNANLHIADRLVGKSLRVLDVGCGSGALIAVLKDRGRIEHAYGLEISAGPAEEARRFCDEVWNESIEAFFPPIPPQSLDYIICADVLEHLSNPTETLLKLKPLLKQSGHLMVSLPNVSNRRVLWDLLVHNDWRYASSGIMDATHLRWFTRKSAARMIEEAGYAVSEWKYVFWGNGGKMIDKLSLGLLSRFTATQLLFVAAALP